VKRPLDKAPPPARGSIRDDETLLFSEAAKRLGLCAKSRRSAIRAGLKVVRFSRWQYTTGKWVREFIEGLAEHQADDQTGGAADG
jgi:hypothetical protein